MLGIPQILLAVLGLGLGLGPLPYQDACRAQEMRAAHTCAVPGWIFVGLGLGLGLLEG